jgi:hypothetical protein
MNHGHIWYECKCHRVGCQFCDGGLGLCTVCGGFEGSLLPKCPGIRLTEEQHDENYKHYCAGTGPFAELKDDHCKET